MHWREFPVSKAPKGIYKRAQPGQLQPLMDYPFEPPRPHERSNWQNQNSFLWQISS
jgi:adenylylsulfate kinase-like enzyme